MKGKIKKTVLIIIMMIGMGCIGFGVYSADYYRADEVAKALESSSHVKKEQDYTVVEPKTPSDTALIFYPGAKVEYTAYLPILNQLAEEGILCIVVEMPFNMAIFDTHAADEIFDKFPEIEKWYIGGHSMGGAMASECAASHPEQVEGLILLGAYIYGEYPPEKTLTVYGTFNDNLEKYIDYTDNIVKIEGGNHAQFGNYGKQKGDPDATITDKEQQRITVEAICGFVRDKE